MSATEQDLADALARTAAWLDEAASDAAERDGFVIDTLDKAIWAVRKIDQNTAVVAAERDEYRRRISELESAARAVVDWWDLEAYPRGHEWPAAIKSLDLLLGVVVGAVPGARTAVVPPAADATAIRSSGTDHDARAVPAAPASPEPPGVTPP